MLKIPGFAYEVVRSSDVPKIYEYIGYIFLFYSNEHEPKHCHVQKSGKEMKVEISYAAGGELKIRFKEVSGRNCFSASEKNMIRHFVNRKHASIVKKWRAFFDQGKKPKFEKINRRLSRPST